MTISEEKRNDLKKRMEALHLFEKDIVEKFILGSGSGGQKINKTSSCVHLFHTPSGIEVKCQKSRSQDMNRFFARRLLVEKLEELTYNKKSKKEEQNDKIRRQKKRRSRRHTHKEEAPKDFVDNDTDAPLQNVK